VDGGEKQCLPVVVAYLVAHFGSEREAEKQKGPRLRPFLE
jgi:hypothetical protein